MKLVIFGLTMSSSWGNGHATLWRGLVRALASSGHDVTFFERDVPYYAAHRDFTGTPGADLVLYQAWPDVTQRVRRLVREADATIVTSYCPDAIAAYRLILDQPIAGLRVFYDLDTPITLAQLEAAGAVDYLPEEGLRHFDLVLSYTGGEALEGLRTLLGARRVAPLYGHVDPDIHCPVTVDPASHSHLSYLGTYAPDRQAALERLFLDPARLRPGKRFVLGGSGYPAEFPWTQNIWFVRHVPPPDHAAFYCSSRLTLNVTRAEMAAMGFCPSGRLFEAAACGAPILSDAWDGLDEFFTPGEQILLANSTDSALSAIDLPASELERVGRAARERVLAEHTSAHRARQLVNILEG
jgi:spore maturation protein CgeB